MSVTPVNVLQYQRSATSGREPEAWAKSKHEGKETCPLAFTETWLRGWALSVSRFGSPFRLDRSPTITDKRYVKGRALLRLLATSLLASRLPAGIFHDRPAGTSQPIERDSEDVRTVRDLCHHTEEL